MKYIFFILAWLFLSQAPAQSLRYNGFYYGREFFYSPEWKEYSISYMGKFTKTIGYQRYITPKYAVKVQYTSVMMDPQTSLLTPNQWYYGLVYHKYYRFFDLIGSYSLLSKTSFKNEINLNVGLSYRMRQISLVANWYFNDNSVISEIHGYGYYSNQLGGLLGISYTHHFCSFAYFNLFTNYRIYRYDKKISDSISLENNLSAGASIGISFGKKHVLAYK